MKYNILFLCGTIITLSLNSLYAQTPPKVTPAQIKGTFTAGQMLKGNGTSAIQAASNLREVGDTVFVDKFLNVDTATLYVDATNNRVGIGTKNPNFALEMSVIPPINNSLQSSFIISNDAPTAGLNASVFALNTKSSNASFGFLNNGNLRGGISFTTANFLGFVNFLYTGANFQLRLNDDGSLGFYDPQNADALRFKVEADGDVFVPDVYSDDIVGKTRRDLEIAIDGQIGYSSSIAASKININAINDLDWLYRLNPVTFNYRLRDENGNFTEQFNPKLEYGLIAEEVVSVAEHLVYFDILEDGSTKVAGVNYKGLITPILKAIQEQQAIIESQATEIEQLKTQIQLILSEIEQIKNK